MRTHAGLEKINQKIIWFGHGEQRRLIKVSAHETVKDASSRSFRFSTAFACRLPISNSNLNRKPVTQASIPSTWHCIFARSFDNAKRVPSSFTQPICGFDEFTDQNHRILGWNACACRLQICSQRHIGHGRDPENRGLRHLGSSHSCVVPRCIFVFDTRDVGTGCISTQTQSHIRRENQGNGEICR